MFKTGQPPALPAPIDVSLPPPFPFDHSAVFVCVDVESYERAHHKITEIGVATLDTCELVDLAPGPNGENWRSKIQAQHFRIQDHAHLVNSEFVSGCPDRFDFGQSSWVKLEDAPARVAACFKPPFAASPHHNSDSKLATKSDTTDSCEQRKLILLGHDTLSDVKYLQQLGFDPLTLPNLLEAQDNATMYRVWRREQQPTKLGNILYDFDIPGFNLHNAGNDAVFTVQAMLGICVREATIRGSPESKNIRGEQKAAKLAQAQADAKQQAEDLAAGWSDDEGDGGAPERIVIKETDSKTPNVRKSDNPSPANGGGLGRGCGGKRTERGHPVNLHAWYQRPSSFEGAPQGGRRGGIRDPGRSQLSGRARGQARGRDGGRGRARETDDLRPVDSFEASGPQVCIDLIDLS
jgi:hypothetical protein